MSELQKIQSNTHDNQKLADASAALANLLVELMDELSADKKVEEPKQKLSTNL